jgi:hypothetical protein
VFCREGSGGLLALELLVTWLAAINPTGALVQAEPGEVIEADDFAAEWFEPVKAEKPKACGGGQCRHRADCADHYCPGRLSASLTGTEARHAHH